MRIVFEGLPGAGKTTQVGALAKMFGWPLIPEFAGFRANELLQLPFKKPWYLALDEIKEFMARQFAEPIVLVDRHYIGTLAYAYALTQVYGVQDVNQQSYNSQLNWYQKQRANQGLTPPDLVFILDIPPLLSLTRQPRARLGDPVWGDEACLNAMREYYHLFFEFLEPNTPVKWLDATRSPSELQDALSTFIKQWSKFDFIHPVNETRAAGYA